MHTELERSATSETEMGHRRFLVAWRHARRREISPVGALSFDGLSFRFTYLPTAHEVSDFRPFLGFPDIDGTYVADKLWPFFAIRVMNRRRPDFPIYAARLGLTPAASELDVLSRSGGERKGDTVQVIEEPSVGQDGSTSCTFLVRGMRYATEEHRSAAVVDELRAGSPLVLRTDSDNEVNPEALLVATTSGRAIGWAPDMLARHLAAVHASAPAELHVLQNNGVEAPWHLRLLVRDEGRVPVDYRPFPILEDR
jgi:hypothetical protein